MRGMFGKRNISLLFCLIAMVLTSCSTHGSTGFASKASADKQVFVFPLDGTTSISTFDPALAADFSSIEAINMTFTGLVQLDDNLQVKPELAQSWTQSEDGLTWTFHLKPNLKFSDGTPVTSKDVAYSINRALLPSMKSVSAPAYLGLIKDSDQLNNGQIKTIIGHSLLTPDDHTIVILANKRASYFLQSLTYSTSYVVEKKMIDKYGNDFTNHLGEGGGTGPWKVQTYDNAGITFVPNPYYYGPKPQLSKVIMPYYKDLSTGYKAYETGQADYATVPTTEAASASQKANEFYKVPQLWINYFGLNYLTKPFDNIHIREAFDLAINKNAIAHSVWKDLNTATNHIVPIGMPGYNPSLTAPDGKASTAGDPEVAKQLLQQGMQEEGYTSISQMPTIRLSYPAGNADRANEVTAVTQMWQSVLGISVKATAVEKNTLYTDINNTAGNSSLQMWFIAWVADYPDPQDWLTLQFDKGAPNNNTNYGQNHSQQAFNQQNNQVAMERADSNTDQASRMQSYNRIEQQLVNDVAWLPTTQTNTAVVLKSYVKGIIFNDQLEIPPSDWANIYIAQH